jgi:hypothetical protein
MDFYKWRNTSWRIQRYLPKQDKNPYIFEVFGGCFRQTSQKTFNISQYDSHWPFQTGGIFNGYFSETNNACDNEHQEYDGCIIMVSHVLCLSVETKCNLISVSWMIRPMPVGRERPAFDENNIPQVI